jgi:hypothetical protein
MSAPSRKPPAVDLLDQATAYVAPYFDPSISARDRLKDFWAAVVAARNLGASDVIEGEFIRLAHDTGLARDLGHHAEHDLRHVIRWAMLDRNPFG